MSRTRASALLNAMRARGWVDVDDTVARVARSSATTAAGIAKSVSGSFSAANRTTKLDVASVFADAVTSARDKSDVQTSAVIFLDLVGSTARLAGDGDESWVQLVAGFYEGVREAVLAAGGRVIKTTGDGFLASIPSPSKAVSVAIDARVAARRLGLGARSGIHLTEYATVETDDVAGLGINIAARIMGVAPANEIAVTTGVRDAVVGLGFQFESLGEHVLKGVPGPWAVWRYLGKRQTSRDSSASAKAGPARRS